MRESSSKYVFDQGLRAWDEIGHDVPGLVACYNMVQRRGRLMSFEPLLDETSGIEAAAWPFPQLFCLKNANYLCGRQKIYMLDSSLGVLSSITVPLGSQWHVADFWDYVVFTNGATRMYDINVTTGHIKVSTLPLCGCIDNFKGQIVAGNVAGHDSNVFVYGGIGYANMTFGASDIEPGFVPMPWQGAIRFVKRLEDAVMVYGDAGVSILTSSPPQIRHSAGQTVAFKHDEAFPFGAVAAGGDIHQHVFIDETGSLWKIGGDLKPQELGYKEFLSPMLGNEIVISFDRRSGFRDFYISDGNVGYVLTEGGLSQVSQRVSSCTLYGGAALGTFVPEASVAPIIETDVLSMGLRARKATEWIELSGEGDWNVQLFASTGGGNFTAGPVLPVPSIAGSNVRAKMAGVDFRVRFTSASSEDQILEQMHYRWKLEDKHTIRGEYAAKATSRPDQ